MASKLLIVVGSGPGIGVGTASVFAANGFTHIALLSRNAERLLTDAKTVQQSTPAAHVTTHPVDVADSAKLGEVLKAIEGELGAPECVLYNASKLGLSEVGEYSVEDYLEDFKIANVGLYQTATWALPLLVSQHKKSPTSHPSFFITNGSLYFNPRPAIFSLAVQKAAQYSLSKSLAAKYGPEGVHVGTVVVGVRVSPDSEEASPTKIGTEFLTLYSQPEDKWEFERRVGC
ncbi:MAG: hypothetical protein M1819_003807 [Sarea resinae]|nr:MAG: hypothetical protein M1819_003807 [Sarea resinae]